MDQITAFANSLADEAGEIIRAHYRTGFDVESKDDASPVTIADRGVEKKLREMIEERFPEDGILGEEFGVKKSGNGRIWVIDPIDGTKSFVIGRPTFGTLIALWDGDTPLLGIIDQPILSERWIGVKEAATFTATFSSPATSTPQKCKTKRIVLFNEARVCSTSPAMFREGYDHIFVAFDKKCRMAWGGDCYAYGLLASGHCDIVVEARLSPYDFAALVPVVKGAGGQITDWDGNELTLKSDGKVIALGNPELWPEVQKLLT